MSDELPGGNRFAQVAGQLQASLGGFLQRRGEIEKAIAPVFFGGIHGLVGMLQQRVDIVGIARIYGDADTGRDVSQFVAETKRLGQASDDFLGDGLDVGTIRQVGQDDREFVAAQTRDRIGIAQATADASGRLLQQDVAHVVPQCVVDLLELVEIDQQECQEEVGTPGLDDLLAQAVEEQPPVGQLRQRARGSMGRIAGDYHAMRLDPFPAAVLAAFAMFMDEGVAAAVKQRLSCGHQAGQVVRVNALQPVVHAGADLMVGKSQHGLAAA